jgi:hypothetical protein
MTRISINYENIFLPVATSHFPPVYREYHILLYSAYKWTNKIPHADPAESLNYSILTLISEKELTK